MLSAREKLRRLSAMPFPRADRHELLLHGDRLIVLSYSGTRPFWAPGGLRRPFGRLYAAAAYRLVRNRIEPLARIRHGEAELLRSVVVGDSLFTLSTGGVKKNGLGAFAVRGWVDFEPGL